MTWFGRACAFATLLSLTVLTDCGGGGGAVIPRNGSPPAPSPSSSQNVNLTILIPAASSTASTKRAQFISSSTQGMLVSVYAQSDTQRTNLLAQTALNVSANAPGCTTNSNGGRTCIAPIVAPPGADTLVFQTYDSAPQNNGFANANLLGIAITNQTINANQANPLHVTIDGIVARIGVSISPGNVTAGSPQTLTVAVTAYDADGDIIVADPYVNAAGNPVTITLSDSDTTGATTLSQTTLNAPGSNITLSYNGAHPVNPTITATAASIPSATAQLTINPGSRTFAYTGATATFTAPPGITAITATATGAQGGSGGDGNPDATGGLGAQVQATIPVSAGTSYVVSVGGAGGNGTFTSAGAAGFNGGGQGGSDMIIFHGGGGGGGGATDLRLAANGQRLLVAGGGGGGGGGGVYYQAPAPAGGSGGEVGSTGIGYPAAYAGTVAGGGGGTATAGGTGGPPGVSNTVALPSGSPGIFATGGAGAVCQTPQVCEMGVYGTGGGGGGWYGGGGGGGSISGAGAGGGGGSSHAIGSATNVTYTTGAQSGNGSLTITW